MRSPVFFLFSLWLCSASFFAQFKWVEIGVNGLTCSQCSRSVEMEIRKLDFVEDVQMDLEHTHGKITFKSGATVYVERIAKAVRNAGFSVRYLTAGISLTELNMNESKCFSLNGRAYQFVKSPDQLPDGNVQIKFIGKEFLPDREYKTWQPELKPRCSDAKEKLFYVTLA